MSMVMRGKKRVWVEPEEEVYDLPQKSVQPVSRGLSMAAPAGMPAGRMTLDELLKRNVASGQILEPLAKQAGAPGWEYMPDAVNESGQAIGTGVADRQQLMSSPLAGYTFDWQDTGSANTGTLTAFDPAGKQAGAYQQQDQSGREAFNEFAGMAIALASAGFGLPGALGQALGLGSGVVGSAVGGGLIGGGTAALTQQDIGKGLLMGGLGGAASGYFGAPAAGGTSGAVDSAALGLDVGSATGNGVFLGEGVLSGIPAWDMAAIPAITSNPAASLDAYSAANPVTMPEVLRTMPQMDSLAAQALVTAPTMGDGAFLGEAPWSPTPASAPAVGLDPGPAPARPADQIRMLEANGLTPSEIIVGSPELAQAGGLTGVGGTLTNNPFDAIRDKIKPLQDWIKANPTLARSGAALLGGLVGGTGGLSPTSARPGTTYTGPARTWGTGLQMGIQPGQQPAWAGRPITQAPGSIRPSTGLRMSGASRYFGG